MNFSIDFLSQPHENGQENQEGARFHAFLYIVFFMAGLAWMLFLCFQSPGTPVQDEIGHYLISKNAWAYPQLILNFWGRTVNTVVYMIPALGGLLYARLFSVLMATVTVLLTTAAAIQLGIRHVYLIPLFLWFQPWFSDLSYEVITEVPLSLCLILGIYFWLRRSPIAAGIAFGLLPLIRHEGVLLLGIWCLYALIAKEWKGLLVSVLPLLAYNLAYYLVYGDIIAATYLTSKPTTFYGHGSWLHFVPRVLDGTGYLIAGLASISIFSVPELGKKNGFFIPFVAYFVVHTVIYRFGLYASGGYGLFLLPLAPGVALAAGLGFEWIYNQINNFMQLHHTEFNRWLLSLFVATVVTVAMMIGLRTPTRPADVEQIASQQAAEWLHNQGYHIDQVVSTHVWFYYYFDLPLVDGAVWTQHPPLSEFQSGTIVVWDAHYSDRGHLFLSELSDPTDGWQRLADFQGDTIILFQKR